MSRLVVAIPVRDEATRIGGCLRALARQSMPADHVVLLLNNCSDGTAEVVKALPRAPHRLHLVECNLDAPSASAGVARGLAMKYATTLIEEGAILTTDADAVVPNNWIEANLGAMKQGAEAVCGRAVIDPIEALLIPPHLHQDDAREVAYGNLLDEIGSIILPDPADPWPRHREDSGASIAMTAAMFRRVGGVPCIASGEDRALIRMLRMIDAPVRHDPNIRVVVSGRIEGRAQGGMADAIRRRIVKQDEFVDDGIEPARAAFLRLRMKRLFRLLWQEPAEAKLDQLARILAIAPAVVADAIDTPYFGQGWSTVEQASPLLAPERVRFVDLPREMKIAQAMHRRLSDSSSEWYTAELTAA
jgi:glycosyltransferase involved in cell wall biosynthesis